MKRIVKIILFLVFAGINGLSAQNNLVLNPGFEQVNGCPAGQSWYMLDSAYYWYNPTLNSVDLFLSCTSNGEFNHVPNNAWGNQIPNTGNNYAGIYAEFDPPNFSQRDYIGGTLADTLINGKKYLVELYINLAEAGNCAFNDIGVYFSDTMPTKKYDPFPVIYYAQLPFIPQVIFDTIIRDSINWVKVSDTLTATGGEKYFAIGLFLENQFAEIDTFSFDTVGMSVGAYYFVDDVSVTMIADTVIEPPTPPTYPEIKLYPIPSNDGVFTLEYELGNGGYMEIHNALGQLVGNISLEMGAHLKTLSLISLASGVYHYRVMADGMEQKAGKLVISK